MTVDRRILTMLGVWAAVAVLAGGILTSYRQPFLSPKEGVLGLVSDPGRGSWRTLHALSDGCGCSQRVMKHLLARHRFSGISELILLVEGPEAALPGNQELLVKLEEHGFPVTGIAAKEIPQQTGLRGVPLLIVASPENRIVYMGGYGSRGDQDGAVLQKIMTGGKMDALPVVGCAVGSRIRRQADPFALKY